MTFCFCDNCKYPSIGWIHLCHICQSQPTSRTMNCLSKNIYACVNCQSIINHFKKQKYESIIIMNRNDSEILNNYISLKK